MSVSPARWSSADLENVWAHWNTGTRGSAFDEANPFCRAGRGNDQFPIAYAALHCAEFDTLCCMTPEELEALRAVAAVDSDMRGYIIAALAWQKLAPFQLPTNAPRIHEDSQAPLPPHTGWPPGMLQDDCSGLSKWLASRTTKAQLNELYADKIRDDLSRTAAGRSPANEEETS